MLSVFTLENQFLGGRGSFSPLHSQVAGTVSDRVDTQLMFSK